CANGVQEGGLRLSLYPGFQDAPIHVRGNYEHFGPRVPRRAPAVLVKKGSGVFSDPEFLATLDAQKNCPLPSSKSGRLELARWIGSPNNPPTARGIANPHWPHPFAHP